MPIREHLEGEIIAALRRIVRAIAVHSHHLVEECGLTGPQLLVLRAVCRVGEIPISALARGIALSQSTTSEIVRRLEQRGLVERQVAEDRRSRVVRITSEGEQKAKAAPSLLQDRFHAALEAREQYEQTHILATLQEIAAMMGAEEIAAAPILSAGPFAEEGPEGSGEPPRLDDAGEMPGENPD